jgi:TRAP-type mannitol/chloroaromatic compound transport system permease small subunit
MSDARRGPTAAQGMLLRLADRIDRVSETVGRVVSFVTFATVAICFATVYLRYALNIGLIWLQELYTWTHVTAIMLGAGYVLKHGGFVRVDLLYGRMTERAKAWVNLLGTLFLMAPFLVMMVVSGWSFFRTSYLMNEASQQDTGLPMLWLLKGTLLAFVATVGLQGLSLAVRSLATILGARRTGPIENGEAVAEIV